jgi:hypothetical protein
MVVARRLQATPGPAGHLDLCKAMTLPGSGCNTAGYLAESHHSANARPIPLSAPMPWPGAGRCPAIPLSASPSDGEAPCRREEILESTLQRTGSPSARTQR